MKTFALAAATLGLAVTATPAFAGSQTVQSTNVSVAGLDLATPEGQDMLEQRIKAAAREVCGLNQPQTGSRIKSLSARTCYNKARASAKKQVAAAIAEQQRGG